MCKRKIILERDTEPSIKYYRRKEKYLVQGQYE